ncbi:hypothetical protein BCR34DRAFT_603621 [Clohesyomyces aquaticus]|uniref:Uncharacterized protein n=1 Tax=Clohesyomyces aquaticus TaxID=1231657 RepID=A0A1Y1ZDK6_9PLEO|nr:hypothetical protein BCR34DRAFT_603621 [Clohesyomyces aquaticus]
MGDIDSSYRLSSTTGPPQLSFYAGTPITSKHSINIGTVFVQRDLDRFVKSRDDLAQVLPEAPTLQPSPGPHTDIEQVKDTAFQNGMDRAKTEEAISPEYDFAQNSESRRLLKAGVARDSRLAREDSPHKDDAYAARDDRQAREDDAYHARDSKTQSGNNDKRGIPQGEATYRKVFRRAAKYLQAGLLVDGVMFSDGLVGSHGTAPQGQKLQQEMRQPPTRSLTTGAIFLNDSAPGDVKT